MQAQSLLAGFRRITSSVKYVPEIDGIRFVAILSVFIFHLAGDILRHSPQRYSGSLQHNPAFWVTQVLNIGVQLFFVLSGYVLALPFAAHYLQGKKAVPLKRYLLRRLTRLEPPYIAALLFLFLVKILAHRSTFGALLPHLAASIGYIHNIVYGQPSEINFVAWSLEIEVQFYSLAPLLSFVFFRNSSPWARRTILLLCCLGCGVAASLFGQLQRIDLSLIGQLPYFLAGMLLADMTTQPVDIQKTRAVVWDIICAALFLSLFGWIYLGWALPYFGPLTIAAAYWSAFRSRFILLFLRGAAVSTIGGMCYSIYLLHNYIIAIAGQFTEHLSADLPFVLRLVIQGCLIAPIVILISGIFFILIERPCMRPDWPRRLVNWIRPGRRHTGSEDATQLVGKAFQEWS